MIRALSLLAAALLGAQAHAYDLTKINSTGFVHLLTQPPTPQVVVKATPVLGIDADENLVVLRLAPDGTPILPSGAATSAKQDEQTALLQQIYDDVAKEAKQDTQITLATDTNTKLDTSNGHLAAIESFLDSIESNVDVALSTRASEATLASVLGAVDGLEGLVTGVQTRLDTVNSNLGTIQSKQDAQTTQLTAINANTDGIEGLLGISNNLLTGVRNDLTLTINAVDRVNNAITGVQSRLDTANNNLTIVHNDLTGVRNDLTTTVHNDLTLANTNLVSLQRNVGDTAEAAASTDTSNSGLNGLFKRQLQRFTTLLSYFSGVVDSTGAFHVNTSSRKTTYSASASFTAATSPTDVYTITGSATKTVKVVDVMIGGTNTGNTNAVWTIVKRSTANSGGTATTITGVPFDSNNAAATAIVRAYTANPTLGNAVGDVRRGLLFLPALSSTNAVMQDDVKFGVYNDQQMTLRGTSESLAVNFGGVNLGGLTSTIFHLFIRWTEE